MSESDRPDKQVIDGDADLDAILLDLVQPAGNCRWRLSAKPGGVGTP